MTDLCIYFHFMCVWVIMGCLCKHFPFFLNDYHSSGKHKWMTEEKPFFILCMYELWWDICANIFTFFLPKSFCSHIMISWCSLTKMTNNEWLKMFEYCCKMGKTLCDQDMNIRFWRQYDVGHTAKKETNGQNVVSWILFISQIILLH